MADVSGPCSTLPGSFHPRRVTETDMCDDHPDRKAVSCIQGETDSFGAEYMHVCQQCLNEYCMRDRTDERTGICSWCKNPATDLRDHRDWTEGSCGPVYRVCGACIKKENDALQEELDNDPDWMDRD